MLRKPMITIKEMTLMAVLVAITIALDAIKLLPMINGGSINGAMIGLALIALSFSPIKTFIATSLIFGLLTALLDGYLAFYVFDYFFALSGFFIISLFRELILKGDKRVAIPTLYVAFFFAFLVRFTSHVISGILYFEVDFAGSVAYNITYLAPSFLLTLIALSFFMLSNLRNQIAKITLVSYFER
jgi:thiamine transporter ThiT